MFLITPEFAARVDDVVKLVRKPKGKAPEGTFVYIANRMAGTIDKEFTNMEYEDVVKALVNAKFQ